jgi:hypothetical protein
VACGGFNLLSLLVEREIGLSSSTGIENRVLRRIFEPERGTSNKGLEKITYCGAS